VIISIAKEEKALKQQASDIPKHLLERLGL
jgi:hypothetical protein